MRTDGTYLRRYAVTILLGLSLATPAAALPAKSDSVAIQTEAGAVNVRIDNFGRVNATYYRGALPVGRDFADLHAIGVKTVIDLRYDGDAAEQGIVEGLGMKFVRIPMTTRETPTAAKLEQFLALVNDPANQPVFVHCQGGRHRTGVMTAVYRMRQEGWTGDRAFAEMKQFKFGSDFLHPEFTKFVHAYSPALAHAVPAVAVAGPGGR